MPLFQDISGKTKLYIIIVCESWKDLAHTSARSCARTTRCDAARTQERIETWCTSFPCSKVGIIYPYFSVYMDGALMQGIIDEENEGGQNMWWSGLYVLLFLFIAQVMSPKAYPRSFSYKTIKIPLSKICNWNQNDIFFSKHWQLTWVR